MPGSISISVEPPRGCPAWLWRMWGRRYLDVIVGSERHSMKWNQRTELPIEAARTRIILWQPGDGMLAAVKLTDGRR